MDVRSDSALPCVLVRASPQPTGSGMESYDWIDRYAELHGYLSFV